MNTDYMIHLTMELADAKASIEYLMAENKNLLSLVNFYRSEEYKSASMVSHLSYHELQLLSGKTKDGKVSPDYYAKLQKALESGYFAPSKEQLEEWFNIGGWK